MGRSEEEGRRDGSEGLGQDGEEGHQRGTGGADGEEDDDTVVDVKG